jgi:hypothetical protein
MGDERLSNLSLLHIHRTRNLSVEDGGVGMIRVDFGPIMNGTRRDEKV